LFFFSLDIVAYSGGQLAICYIGDQVNGLYSYVFFFSFLFLTWLATIAIMPILIWKIFFANRMAGAGSRGKKHVKVLCYLLFYFVALTLSLASRIQASVIQNELTDSYTQWFECNLFLYPNCGPTKTLSVNLNITTYVFNYGAGIVLFLLFGCSKEQFVAFGKIIKALVRFQRPQIKAPPSVTRERSTDASRKSVAP